MHSPAHMLAPKSRTVHYILVLHITIATIISSPVQIMGRRVEWVYFAHALEQSVVHSAHDGVQSDVTHIISLSHPLSY